MSYGLFLSASGVLTNMYRQDVFANNLANVETTGFKPDIATVKQRDPESIENSMGFKLRQPILDNLGGGVLAGPQRISTKQGALKMTNGKFDVAIKTPGAFFAVETTDPNTNEKTIRLTRDGRFTPNDQGFMVTASSGYKVLDENDQPIEINPNQPIRIDDAGRIIQNENVIAKIQVIGADVNELMKSGENLLEFKQGYDGRRPLDYFEIKQGFVESSAVDPITALMKLIDATKAVTTNGNLIRYHDSLTDKAVNVLGKVS